MREFRIEVWEKKVIIRHQRTLKAMESEIKRGIQYDKEVQHKEIFLHSIEDLGESSDK